MFKAGNQKGVKTAYWRDGAFGRGPIQLSLWPNYEKFGKLLGIPLRKHPAMALELDIGADVAVIGMRDGEFRGDKQGRIKLSRFKFPDALNAKTADNPRRINANMSTAGQQP